MTIRTHTHTRLALALFAAGTFALAACDGAADTGTLETGDNVDESTISYAGFALTDDDDADDSFGEDSDPEPLLDELDEVLDDADEAPTAEEMDPVPSDPPDRVVRTVLVLWGQPRLNPDVPEPSLWEGEISSDVAAVRVLRKIRFEGADHLIPDGDPRSVTFRTNTKPHHDGVLLRIAAPRAASTLAGSLRFRTTKFQKTIPLADLLDGFHHVYSADDLGNALVVSTVREHRCGQGVLRMMWKRVDARGGIFGGKVYGPEGEIKAFVAGVWGRVADKRRFKGFFLNADRQPIGVLKGAYAPFPAVAEQSGGVFRGVWVLRNREVGGVLGGVYRVGEEPGQGTAFGHLIARCDDDAPSCEADLDLPEPPAADCSCGPDADNADVDTCECVVEPAPSCIPVEPVVDETSVDDAE